MSEQVVILGARRTPIGAFQGALAAMTATQLGAAAARAAIEDSGLASDQLDEVILGCVLQAGQGQAPARQAALGAGIPLSVPATTVNKMCGSGMKSVMLGADQIRAGNASAILAGGFESMTNAPYLLQKARGGYRMGHGEILDHMFSTACRAPGRQGHGLLCRRHRGEVRLHARGAGRLRRRNPCVVHSAPSVTATSSRRSRRSS